VTVSVATPAVAVSLLRPVTVPAPFVWAKVTTVELSPVSRLLLASRISAVRSLVEPETTLAVLLVKVRWSAGPTMTEKVEGCA
jgi:hypothetical protein